MKCGPFWRLSICLLMFAKQRLLWRLESNLSNAIAWVSASNGDPWKLHFILNEIKTLSSLIQEEFNHIVFG